MQRRKSLWYLVPDPDLEIAVGGGGGGRGSGHPDPKIRVERSPPKKFFQPFGPQFGPKVRGALPWIHHWYNCCLHMLSAPNKAAHRNITM